MLKDAFHTATTIGAVVGLTGVVAPSAIVAARKDPRGADAMISAYGRWLLKSAGVRHEAHGLERLPEGSFILACNHESHFDALLLLAHVRRHLRFVAKQELFNIPVFGTALHATGFVRVNRKGGDDDRKRMSEAVEAVRGGLSLVFFPEGTRNDDGQLKEFRQGAARLAILAQVPLVPVAVGGTRDILPKKSLWVRGGRRAALCVGEPISTEGKTLDDRAALTAKLREAVSGLLDEARAKVGS